jgi:imidazolonepropionase-like amidohydrolase
MRLGRVVLALVVLLAPQAGQAQDSSVVALVNATVVDVERGVLVPRQTIVTSRGRIDQVGPTATVRVPRGATRVDLAGRFVMPGLWDMHVHMGSRAPDIDAVAGYFGSLFLRNGVTGIRDAGDDPSRLNALDSISRARPGVMPRLLHAGAKVGPAEGASWTMSNVQPEIDARVKAGAKYIKLVSDYPVEHFTATLAACSAARLRCVAHVPPADTSTWLSVPGRGSFEHVFNLSEHVSRVPAGEMFKASKEYRAPTLVQRILYKLRLRKRPDEPGLNLLAQRDTTRDQAFFARVASAGNWITPTLILHHQLTRTVDLLPAAIDPELSRVPATEPQRSESDLPRHRSTWDLWTGIVRSMQAARVQMMAGTDFSGMHVPGAALHAELVLLQQAGVPAAEVLRMATLNPARYLGAADSLGSVAAGRVADLVVVRANPLDDVGNVAGIEMVMTRGRLLRQAALDSLTSRAKSSLARLRASAATARP